MATEICMSCTCTSAVRGAAKGLLFLPLPHLCAEAFQEIPPTWARRSVAEAPGCSAWPGDTEGELPTLGWLARCIPVPAFLLPSSPPLLLCSCHSMREWTHWPWLFARLSASPRDRVLFKDKLVGLARYLSQP